jgi:hypothetical protein
LPPANKELGIAAMRIRGLVVLALVFCLAPRATAAEDALFPFVVSYDAPPTVTNVSA